MLDELTIEANEESFVIALHHGGNDVTWKRSIPLNPVCLFVCLFVCFLSFFLSSPSDTRFVHPTCGTEATNGRNKETRPVPPLCTPTSTQCSSTLTSQRPKSNTKSAHASSKERCTSGSEDWELVILELELKKEAFMWVGGIYVVSTDDMRGYRVLVAWIVITGSMTYVYNGRGTTYFEMKKKRNVRFGFLKNCDLLQVQKKSKSQ